MELTGLSNRILRDFNDYSLFGEMINFNNVYEALTVERKHSVSVMKELLP